MINNLIKKAKANAWASIQRHPDVIALTRAQNKENAAKYNRVRNPSLSRQQHDDASALLNIYK